MLNNTITKENVEKFKSYGFVLTPVVKSNNPNEDKKPVAVAGSWFKDWKDEQLLSAERIGVYHKDSNIYDIDFDDKSYRAHQFIDMLPPTFTIGKKVNGKVIATHKIYRKPDDSSFKPYSYPRSVKKGETIIESLGSTQSIIAGVDRVIINNVEPTVLDPSSIEPDLRCIVAFSELLKHIPKKDDGQRNHFYFRLGGALASQTDIQMEQRIKYVEKLCELTNDVAEVKNRVSCIQRQQQKYEAGEETFGMKELSEFLDVNLKGFDEIKRKKEEYKIEFPMIDGSTLLNTKYVKPNFILEPILREKSITQVSGGYGAGKTQLGIALALAVAHGRNFLDYEIRKDNPILYVEAELCGSDIQDRIISLNYPFLEMNSQKNNLKPQNQFTLSQDDLINAGIQYGFPDLAVADDETRASVGRLAIENLVERIKEKTGKFPILFLDNISALTSIDENKAKDWSSFMRWLIKLKSKGISSVIFHHINKSTGSASGSNMSQRLIDTHIILKRLDEDSRFDISGKSVQCSVHFDKFRNFGGDRVKPFMLTCNDEGVWNKYPMLDQINVKIIAYHNKGLSVKEMCEQEEDWKDKTIYKRIKKLKEDKIIDEANRQTSHY